MRVLFATLGSAGDTHPYIAIGEELIRRGHEVAMVANPHFEARIRSVGIGFIPLGNESDFLSVLHDPRLANQGQSPYLVIQALFNKLVEPSYLAMQDAVKAFKPDVIVRHHILFAAGWVAEQHKIPCVTGVLTPSLWFSTTEPMILRSYIPIAIQQKLGGLIRFGGKHVFRWLVDRPVNQARRRLGLPKLKDVFFRETLEGKVLGLWSQHFRGPLPDDPADSEISGYCFFDRASGEQDKQLDPALEAFLSRCESKGREPAVFTLGTTIVHHAQDFFPSAVEACRLVDRPAILLVGKGEKPPAGVQGPDVLVCQYAPHSLLFPRCCASIHHAGAGSASQAMRSGKPSVAIPFVNDEFDIAHRMKRLGVAAYLPANRFKHHAKGVGNLAECLRQVTVESTFRDQAAKLGQQIRAENGAQKAASAVESKAST